MRAITISAAWRPCCCRFGRQMTSIRTILYGSRGQRTGVPAGPQQLYLSPEREDGGTGPERESTGGKWELVEDIIFTPEGKRYPKVVYAPVVSLRNIGLTPEDEKDLRDVQPFVLTRRDSEYDIHYLGGKRWTRSAATTSR